MPGSQAPIVDDIETCSNVGIPGLFVYRVDQYDIIQPNHTNGNVGRLKRTCKYELRPQYATICCWCCSFLEILVSKSQPIYIGDNITLTCINGSNNLNYSYEWSLNEISIPNEDMSTLVISEVMPTVLGQYKCTINMYCTEQSATFFLEIAGNN